MKQFALSSERIYRLVALAILVIVVGGAISLNRPRPPSSAGRLIAELEPLPRVSSPLPPDPIPASDIGRYLEREIPVGQPPAGLVSKRAMIAATTNPFAVRVGLEVLNRGGNAMDAALTTSLAQIALNGGATVSYAGLLNAVYYEASTDRVHTLNASYNTVREEKSPLTIPVRGRPSGRTALVPGFMAGVEALHRRFGSVPFAKLFEPAIWIAEHGVPLNTLVARGLKSHAKVITRLPETKRVFTKPGGGFYQVGELWRQPELAATLRAVATEGASYMYSGAWAQRCVQLVRQNGGKMTLDDFANYRASWGEPAWIDYHGFRVASLDAPNFGGELTLGSLKIAELAQLHKYGPTIDSAEALFLQIRIGRAAGAVVFGPRTRYPPRALLKRETAAALWNDIKEQIPAPVAAEELTTNHSAGVVAVDTHGNVVSLLHSINTVFWGSSGIFVDGISIPDSAVVQIRKIAETSPGARLSEASNPLVVLRGGKPVLVSVSIGSGLHPETFHHLVNILDFDMDPQSSVQRPAPRGPFLGDRRTADYTKEAIGKDDFSKKIIEGVRVRGQPISIVDKYTQAGYWAGIQIDPATGRLSGGVSGGLNGTVEGF